MSLEINIRKAMVNDAEQIIEHIKRILKENPSFMATTPEEFTVSVVEQREQIVNCSERGLIAIHLYTKLGFKEEGRRNKHVKFGPNEYVDDIIMSQFVK